MAKFVERDQSQLYLLPVDIREWVPEDDLSHFVVEAVNRVPMSAFVVNERVTGSAQYHPRMMSALLVNWYANGIFAPRRIARGTYRDIGVRYVASNCHPDHDTICTFRRDNSEAVAKAFEQVLLLAKELKLLRLGTVSVDGTKVDANANKRNSIRYDRPQALRSEIGALLSRAEQEDSKEAVGPQALPQELARHERLRERLDQACTELERRARLETAAARTSYERKVSEPERRKGSRKGRRIKAPKEEPDGKQQINLTDADSGLMRRSKQHEYRQAHNAQAVVDAGGSQLVLGARVNTNASDRRELVADVDAIPASLGTVMGVLADNGYAAGSEVARNWNNAAWGCWQRRRLSGGGDTTSVYQTRRGRSERFARTGLQPCARRWRSRKRAPVTGYVGRRWNRCSGSSSRRWAFGSSFCAASTRSRASGVW